MQNSYMKNFLIIISKFTGSEVGLKSATSSNYAKVPFLVFRDIHRFEVIENLKKLEKYDS